MPAVASIFTGLHPRSHGAVGPYAQNDDDTPGGTLLPDGAVTLAELAQQAGVTTFGVSTNTIVSRATNMAQGFETFVELPFDRRGAKLRARNGSEPGAPRLARTRGSRPLLRLRPLHGAARSLRPATRAAPAATRGHAPRSRGRLDPGLRARRQRRPRGAAVAPRARSPAPVVHGDVRSWDDALGTLLRELADRGVLDRTVVVVMADHGEEFLEHGNLTHGGHLYEETVRIPLVVVGPGIPAGRRPDMAQGIDLLPTIAPVLGAPVPPALPGRDLLTTRADRRRRVGDRRRIRRRRTGEWYDLAAHGAVEARSLSRCERDRALRSLERPRGAHQPGGDLARDGRARRAPRPLGRERTAAPAYDGKRSHAACQAPSARLRRVSRPDHSA